MPSINLAPLLPETSGTITLTDVHQLPLDQMIEGDCLEVLPQFPADSFDLIFVNPPYNLQLRQDLWRPNLTRVEGVNDAWDQIGGFDEYKPTYNFFTWNGE